MSFGLLTEEQGEILRRRYGYPDEHPGMKPVSKCLHNTCPECHGTGVRKDGSLCIHSISCLCDKCSVR